MSLFRRVQFAHGLLVVVACLAVRTPTVSASEPAPFGLETRIEWTTSRLKGSPDPPLPYTVEKSFTGIPWVAPIYIAIEPGTDNLWVVLYGTTAELPSRIVRLQDDPATTRSESLLELPGRYVYSVCFDPNYAANRRVYVFTNDVKTGSERVCRVSRHLVEQTPPHRIDPKSEEPIIEWPSDGHNGGDMAFGPDGMLYITTGDGTSDSDTGNAGQTLDDLLGSVLRIDVSRHDGDRRYSVPRDNPFVGTPGARGEIWAYGLRNPWRMDIDQRTGHVWVGNNGQDLWETAHLVRAGDNCGWSVNEGSHPFYPERKRGPTPIVSPTIEHSHADFRSLTGGVVYYGRTLQELEGVYIYGDYSSGKIWGMKHDGQRVIWHRELADTTLQIAGFRVDQRGELLVIDHAGALYRLVPAAQTVNDLPFARLLSETGLFASVRDHIPVPGVIAYSVNAPAWNDGATAERFIAIPSNFQVGYDSTKSWTFPDGTALVETLAVDQNSNTPVPPTRVETRVLLKQQGEWAGYSYCWNAEQNDAVLAPKEGALMHLATGEGADQAQTTQWHVPSRTECMACHSRAANFVLGVTEQQLNRKHDYGGVTDNQLRVLDHIGLFSTVLPKPPAELGRFIDPFASDGDIETRARIYLHVNCSGCHVAAGGGNAQMELALSTPRTDMKLIGARPQHDSFGINDAMLIAPGTPDRSVLVHRLSRRGRGQMPPLASSRVDQRAVQLMRDWIAGIKSETKIVRQWTVDDLVPELGKVNSDRSLTSGRDAFQKTGCVQCHRLGRDGGTVGPDLSGIERRLSARELLEAVLLPSKVIADEYAVHAFEMDDGRVVIGRIEREDDNVVVVRPGSAIDKPTEIEKQSIVERQRTAMSNMPEGIVNVLEKEQVLDLLAYMLAGGKVSDTGAP